MTKPPEGTRPSPRVMDSSRESLTQTVIPTGDHVRAGLDAPRVFIFSK
jgi:hypothetical protein